VIRFCLSTILICTLILITGISYSYMVEGKKTLQLSVSEQIAYSTVKIDVEYNDGTKGSGTGFFFSFPENDEKHIPLVITNKHVIRNSKTGYIHMTLANDEGSPLDQTYKNIKIENFEKNWIFHPDDQIDLAAMPIAPLIEQADKSGIKLFYIPLNTSLIPSNEDLSQLGAVEDILMVGYPIGLWDEVNNYPIFRRGITATHPARKYNGRREFLIDAACFPGSSGSPVFLYNMGSYAGKEGGVTIGSRIKLLGILWGGPQYSPSGTLRAVEIPTGNTMVLEQYIPINLGYVVKSDAILDFKKILDDIIQKMNAP